MVYPSLPASKVKHVVEALATCPAFDGLEKGTMAEIGQIVEYRVLEKMAPAFLQGEETDAMVVILSGRCVRETAICYFEFVCAISEDSHPYHTYQA